MSLSLPITWLNGHLETQVSIYDRGLMYGQSLFETIPIINQRPILLDQHLSRLQQGAQVLGIPLKLSVLQQEIESACEFMPIKSAILRLSVTMGEGGRGYHNPQVAKPNRLLTLYDYPVYPNEYWEKGINLGLSGVRLAQQPLFAGLKHSNRLEQVMARSQWQSDWQEAILLDHEDRVIEGTQSNVFIVSNKVLKTPDLRLAGVAGVMRGFILDQVKGIGLDYQIKNLTVEDIENADEIFMTNSVIGLWPVRQFAERIYNHHPISETLLTCINNHELISNY